MTVSTRIFSGLLAACVGLVGAGCCVSTASAASPTAVSSTVTDSADVLSSDQEQQLAEAITALQKDRKIKMEFVFVDSFDGQSGTAWAKKVWETNPQSNVYVVAIATEGNYGVSYGKDISSSQSKKVTDAMYPKLVEHDWQGAALAAVKALEGGSGSIIPWGVGALVIVVVAGGVWVLYTRRKASRLLEAARAKGALGTADVENLPDAALESLAKEELASTDASIRAATQELELARGEFGPQRVRPLLRALEASRQTLERAFALNGDISSGLVAKGEDRRAALIDIVTSCNSADQVLNAQAQEFRSLRETLMDAPKALDALTQQIVGLHARLPESKVRMEGLRARYTPQALASINDNIDMASQHLTQAEQVVEQARDVAAKPAGEQGNLVDLLRAAQVACSQAQVLLDEIDSADTRISQARTQIDDLIAEIKSELAEAGELARANLELGVSFDKEGLDAAATRAWDAVSEAEKVREADPLSAYKLLMTADEELDEALDAAKGERARQSRDLELMHRAQKEASDQLDATNAVISTRGFVVGSTARTLLSQAQAAFDEGQGLTGQPRQALAKFRQARTLATQAAQEAQQDVNRHDHGGDSTGAFVAGMLLSNLFNSSGHSSWGGGDWGGGSSWGGGDWGGGSDGSF